MYNGHADVTALLEPNGQMLATYYYDAFGKILESIGGINNPYKYAGYQYDSETGLYYLNARMYDPVTARFLQEDTYRGNLNDPLSLNLYTYCHNNPITYDDPSGHFIHVLAGAAIGGLVNSAITAISDYADDGKLNKGWKEYAGAFVEGATIGGIGAATGGTSLLALVASEAVAGTVGNTAKQYISKGKVNAKEAMTIGAISGLTAGTVKVVGAAIKPLFKTKTIQQLAARTQAVVQNTWGKVKTAVSDSATMSKRVLASERGSMPLGSSTEAGEVGNKKYLGGKHGNTKNPAGDGIDSHHMPAKQASPLDTEDGPAIQMDPADHRRTASYGGREGSPQQAYRDKQKNLIDQGKFDDAFLMDVDDIQSKFGNKYNEAILGAIDALPKLK